MFVEVLSSVSEITEMRDKLQGYFTIASVRHYLIVNPE
jgi:Uma2 family endonuclease